MVIIKTYTHRDTGNSEPVAVNAYCDASGDVHAPVKRHAWISFGEVTLDGFNPCYACIVVPVEALS